MAYEKKTIADTVDRISKNEIFLPAIQRKFVWDEEQISTLMDSIMRGYPFGTFLFWRVKKRTVNENRYSMYSFIKDYHERDRYKNDEVGRPFNIVENNEEETILSVLDGQQRLTSLFIALQGSMSTRLPKKHRNNDDAYPKKELYFNLLSGENVTESDEEDTGTKYEFVFLTPEKAAEYNSNKIWFRVKDILQYSSIRELNSLMRKSDWFEKDIACENIAQLFQRIKIDEIINYFEVATDSIDSVLDIFVRVNSGGTVLSKSDLLFSTIVSYWNDGRNKIDELITRINGIGQHYNFKTDLVLRACLYVLNMDLKLKVESFREDSVRMIETNWQSISGAFLDTVAVLNELGFYAENIVADNAVLPLFYYRYLKGQGAFSGNDVKQEVRKYMVVAQINHLFGHSTNTTLKTIRDVLSQHPDEFKLLHLQHTSFGDRDFCLDEATIEGWFDEYEKGPYTFMLLSLLDPSLKFDQRSFDQDHLHPYSAFKKESNIKSIVLPDGKKITPEIIKSWQHRCNTLANLQLLDESANKSKNDMPLEDWLKTVNPKTVSCLPVMENYSLENFELFYQKRKELMLAELKKTLLGG